MNQNNFLAHSTEEFWDALKETDGLICFGSYPKFEYWAFNSTKNCADFSDPSCGVWSYDFEHFKILDEKINILFNGVKNEVDLSKELNVTESRLFGIRERIERQLSRTGS